MTLRVRMALVFGLLLTGVAVFMVFFFPARMAEQAQAYDELRARTVTQVMANAVAPSLEFDDADHANHILTWLAATPDARFAVVIGDHGERFAAWSPERIPARLPRSAIQIDDNQLVTSAPVQGRGGTAGTVYIGQSLDQLVTARKSAQRTVVTASAIVLFIGLLACFVIATALVRPLERLTTIAHDIARGDKPPRIAAVTGGVEVLQMTRALGTMLDRLNEANSQLVQASRHAGMAEVATGVLHNVGNILTSVNVGIESISERVGELPAERVRRAADLLANGAELDIAVKYLTGIAEVVSQDRGALLTELVTLRGHVDHVNRVVTMQNAYARTGGVDEQTELAKLIDEAIALGCANPGRIEIERRVDDATVMIDRHRVLQILVNLIANARDSLTAFQGADMKMCVTCGFEGGSLAISVADTGGGIASESLVRIFNAGFTTKRKGHGYGLHSSALTAEQLGGTLRCHSDGPGKGASFTLVIPIQRAKS